MVGPGLLGQAAGMFVATNIDDMLVLVVFFGQAAGKRSAAARVVAGQFLGFGAILAVSVLGAFGVGLLPEWVVPYLGLVPILLGLHAGWSAWREHRAGGEGGKPAAPARGMGMLAVAGVTLANGGDNIAVYVPVFALAGVGGTVGYVVVFAAGMALWCALGRLLAGHPLVATALSRWGHVILPVVLVGIGLIILIGGGAFGR